MPSSGSPVNTLRVSTRLAKSSVGSTLWPGRFHSILKSTKTGRGKGSKNKRWNLIIEVFLALRFLLIRSVIGLSFDFLGLNVVGFTMYSLFNIGLYWVPGIQVDSYINIYRDWLFSELDHLLFQAEYFSRHPTGVNPVQLNDVIFSLHAVFACVVTIAQCIIYEARQSNKIYQF